MAASSPAPSATTNIPVDPTPHSVAVSRDGSHLYVSHFLSGSVSVLDTAAGSVAATITGLPSGTYGVAAGADGKFLYVANPHSQFLRRIRADGAPSAEAITAGVGAFCYGLALGPHGDVLYAACAREDRVILLDTLVKNTGEIKGIDFPVGVAASPDGTRLYATNYFSGTVSVLELAGQDVTKIDVPPGPYGIAVDSGGSRVYVAHFHTDGVVSVIDAKSLEVVRRIATGNGPTRGVAVSPDDSRLYVTNYFSGSVSVLTEGIE